MNSTKPSRPYRGGPYRPERFQRQSRGSSPSVCLCDSSLRSIVNAVLRGTGKLLGAVPAAVWYVAGATLIGWMLIADIKSALDTPAVYRSWLTKECVRVENADGTRGDCRALPRRYSNVWVD